LYDDDSSFLVSEEIEIEPDIDYLEKASKQLNIPIDSWIATIYASKLKNELDKGIIHKMILKGD
jgi:hypothetical protein